MMIPIGIIIGFFLLAVFVARQRSGEQLSKEERGSSSRQNAAAPPWFPMPF